MSSFLQTGDIVRLSGLLARADLNGSIGRVLAPASSGERWAVRLTQTGEGRVLQEAESIRVKPANLALYVPPSANEFITTDTLFHVFRMIILHADGCEDEMLKIRSVCKLWQDEAFVFCGNVPPLSIVRASERELVELLRTPRGRAAGQLCLALQVLFTIVYDAGKPRPGQNMI